MTKKHHSRKQQGLGDVGNLIVDMAELSVATGVGTTLISMAGKIGKK